MSVTTSYLHASSTLWVSPLVCNVNEYVTTACRSFRFSIEKQSIIVKKKAEREAKRAAAEAGDEGDEAEKAAYDQEMTKAFNKTLNAQKRTVQVRKSTMSQSQ